MMAHDGLSGLLENLTPLLDRYGYLAIAGIVGVESFGVPAPAQTIVVAAAVYASAGGLNIAGVAAVAFLAAVLGDNLGYGIGRAGSRRLVLRFGRYLLLTPARLGRAEQFYTRHGPRIIVAARFIDGLRQFNGIIAGITAITWPRFVTYNAISAALWAAAWTTLGYLAGNHINAIYETIHRYQWYALATLAVTAAAYAALHVARRRSR